MAIKNRFAELVEQKRQRDGLAWLQDEIAKAADVSPAIVSHYMNDKIVNFNKSTMARLARWLGCDPGDLIAWEDEADTESKAPAGTGALTAAL